MGHDSMGLGWGKLGHDATEGDGIWEPQHGGQTSKLSREVLG